MNEARQRNAPLVTEVEAIQRERDRAQSYLDLAGVVFVALNEKGEITLLNKKGCDLLRCSEKDALGKGWFDTFLPANVRQTAKAVFHDLVAGRVKPVEYHENPVLTTGGIERVVAWHNAVLRDDKGKIIGTLASGEDVTERKRTEERLRRSREQLRALAHRLQSVREEARARQARIMHDNVGHALAALKMDLSWLSRHMAQADPRFRDRMKDMSDLLDDAIRSVRALAAELRPGVLDDLGVAAALEWETRQFETRSGIPCKFVCPEENISLDHEQRTALFRVCQELLTNVAQHAEATAVEVSLRKEANHLLLEVKDNGKGITDAEATSHDAVGILGIRERALLLNGKVSISGAPGKGTTAVIRIPLGATAGT